MPRPETMTTIEMLDRLVSFDTTSRDSNLPLIDFVRDYLSGHGVESRLIPDASGRKASLHAVIGPEVPGGLGLSGHVDTVPVDGQAWTGDPFRLRREDGRLVGRGTTDMKGFVASMLAAVPTFRTTALTRPIHLMITHDEETDFSGARNLAESFASAGARPELCIVGEPTGMRPVIAHKGRVSCEVTVRGRAGHSSEPGRGVNAVQAGAEAVAWIAGEARRLAKEGPFTDGFDPPHTTIHVGRFEGGAALNIIPEHARFVMEWRLVPGDDPDAGFDRLVAHVERAILPTMRAVDPAAGFRFDRSVYMPGLDLPADHPLVSMVRQLTGRNDVGRVSYGTEACLFQQSGIASIVCGPGDIAQAHTADEWVAESELASCDDFLRRLASRLAA